MRIMERRGVSQVFVLLIMWVIFPAALSAADVEGITFENSIFVDRIKLDLTGAGLLRYWGIKAYAGALYLEAGSSAEDALADRAKRIEIEYLRPIKGKDFGPATDRSIAKNVDQATYERLRPRIDYHNSLYQDVAPGDRYSLTYIPGKGTELALNGEFKGTIEGADFASAIFSIWLGPEPISASFKKQILGQ